MSYDLTSDDYWAYLGYENPNALDMNSYVPIPTNTTTMEGFHSATGPWTQENETTFEFTTTAVSLTSPTIPPASSTKTSMSIITADKIGSVGAFPASTDDDLIKHVVESIADWAKVIFAIILFLLGFLTYLYVLLCLCRRKMFKQDPINWYMFNIGLCNTLFLFTFPLFLVEDFVTNAEAFSGPVCLAREIILFLNHFVTVVLLMVCFVVFRRRVMQNWGTTAKTPKIITAATWTAPVVMCFIVTLITRLVSERAVAIVFGAFSAGVFVLCSMVIVFGYVLRHSRQTTKVPRTVSGQIEAMSTQGTSTVPQNSNATRNVVGMLATWTFICYVIFHVLHLLNEFGAKQQDGLCGKYDVYIFFAAYGNAAINPFIFLLRDIIWSKEEPGKQAQDKA